MGLFGTAKMPEPTRVVQPPSNIGADTNAANAARLRQMFAGSRQSTILAGWQPGQYKTTMG